MKQNFVLALLLALIILPAPSFAESSVDQSSVDQSTTDESETEPGFDDGSVFEVGLGNSQVFFPDQLSEELRQVVPTDSVLLMVEYYLHYRWHLSALFNWPTGTAVSIVDGELVENYVAPLLALGVIWTPLSVPFSEARHRFEVHLGVFGGVALRKQFTPNALFAIRAYALHESEFGVYVGAASSFIIDTAALIYGIGYRF